MGITARGLARPLFVGLVAVLLSGCTLPTPFAQAPTTDRGVPSTALLALGGSSSTAVVVPATAYPALSSTPRPQGASVTPFALATTPAGDSSGKPDSSPSRASAQPAFAQTPIITVNPPAAAKAWHGWPVGPAVSEVLTNDTQAMAWTNTASLTEVERFYRMQASTSGAMLVEALRSKSKNSAGEVLFLNLARSDRGVCLLAYTEQASTLTNLLLSEACDIVRAGADEMRVAPWSTPSDITWRTWTAAGVTMRYPAAWTRDTSLAQQSYCQTSTGIQCLVAFNGGNDAVDATVILTSQAHATGQSLEEFATEGLQSIFATATRVELLMAEPIQLDDEAEAFQLAALVEVRGVQALFIQVCTTDDKDVYNITGTITGDLKDSFELPSIVLAAARSLQVRP